MYFFYFFLFLIIDCIQEIFLLWLVSIQMNCLKKEKEKTLVIVLFFDQLY